MTLLNKYHILLVLVHSCAFLFLKSQTKDVAFTCCRTYSKVMIHRPNVTVLTHQREGQNQGEWQRSECVLGYIPVVYYSALLCVGVPGRRKS